MRPRPDQVLARVAEVYQVPVAELRGRCRRRHVGHARQAAMLALRRLCELSLEAIGAQLDGRDHTTVQYGIDAAEDRARHDVDERRRIDLVLAIGRLTPASRPAPRLLPGARHYAKVSAA